MACLPQARPTHGSRDEYNFEQIGKSSAKNAIEGESIIEEPLVLINKGEIIVVDNNSNISLCN